MKKSTKPTTMAPRARITELTTQNLATVIGGHDGTIHGEHLRRQDPTPA